MQYNVDICLRKLKRQFYFNPKYSFRVRKNKRLDASKSVSARETKIEGNDEDERGGQAQESARCTNGDAKKGKIC